ncbi:TPA: hypothetical protein ACLM89_001128 [Neisseria meningitidis]
MPSEALSDGICIPKQNEHTPHPALPLRIRHKLRPLQNSLPSRQPKPKHRFSAVFAPNTS